MIKNTFKVSKNMSLNRMLIDRSHSLDCVV